MRLEHAVRCVCRELFAGGNFARGRAGLRVIGRGIRSGDSFWGGDRLETRLRLGLLS